MKEIVRDKNFNNMLQQYISNDCFKQNIKSSGPYLRPINKNKFNDIDFSTPIDINNLSSDKNLILNQLLLSIYEQDLLFLNFNNDTEYYYFKMFYDPQFVALGKVLKPILEHLVFHFLKNEVEIIGDWDKQTTIKYLSEMIFKEEQTPNKIAYAINSSKDPLCAVQQLLIQLAPDFLSEASAMARTLPGSFGVEQSEIMKIFIDEYGYGVHHTKHSTLFENTMKSVGLNPAIHQYYNDYLATSLMLVNYYHYISSNKLEWFRYMGALYYTEAIVPHAYKQLSAALRKTSNQINTKYFDEHVHIDSHHRRMVLDNIIVTSIDKYGHRVIGDILTGFEEFRMLQRISDDDVIRHIKA